MELQEPIFPMRTAKIIRVIEENYKTKTFEFTIQDTGPKTQNIGHTSQNSSDRRFGHNCHGNRISIASRLMTLNALPGQFLMVWLPGIGERPMGIADNDPLTISVADVGKVTAEMHKLKEGELLFFRGPFGNGFTLPKKSKNEKENIILLVAGGTGVVPLHFLAKKAKMQGYSPIPILGAKTKAEHTYHKHMQKLCTKTSLTTDDGSEGKKGTAVDEMRRMIEEGQVKPACVYSCGPERMMRAVAEYCKQKKIPCQLSLERYMKCGMGICGSCDINGKLVCKDGPVFDGFEVLGFEEFGKTKRDGSGAIVNL